MKNHFFLLSKHRPELMGFAIICVCIFHINIDFANPILNTFKSLGYSGVDIFFFVSGYGLYYSFMRDNNLQSFYKKRIYRIIPTYWILILIFHLLQKNYSITNLLLHFSTIGFWIPIFPHSYFDWYVPSLLAFYFIFPFYMKYFEKKKEKALVQAILIGFSLTLILILLQKGSIILFTSRIPIFFIGTFFGYLSQKKTFNKKNMKHSIVALIYLAIIFIVVQILLLKSFDDLFLWRSSLYWTPVIFIIPGLCIAISKGFDLLKDNNIIRIFFSFMGGISFELYLIHTQIYVFNIEIHKIFKFSIVSSYLFLLAVSIISAYIFSLLMKFFKCKCCVKAT